MTTSPMKTRALLALGVATLAALSDQATKEWALHSLSPGEVVPILGDVLTLTLVHNPGAAFSVGSGTTWLFTVVSVVILVVLVAVVHRGCSLPTAAVLGLLGGGAVGNLVDRLIRAPGIGVGHVVDFINYNDWFVGNVADIWIVLAAVGLVLVVGRQGTGAVTDEGEATIVEDEANTVEGEADA